MSDLYDFNETDDFAFEEFEAIAGSANGNVSWDAAIEQLQETYSIAPECWHHIRHAVHHARPSAEVDVYMYVIAYRLAHLVQELGMFDLEHPHIRQSFDVVRNDVTSKPVVNQEQQRVEVQEAFRLLVIEGQRIVVPESRAPAPNRVVDLVPCPYGPNCLMQFVDVHGDHTRSVCSKPLSCPHTGDLTHARQYIHICPRFAGCDELGREHFSLFKHRQPLCPQELNHLINPAQSHYCTHDTRDRAHFSMYLHRCTAKNCHEVNYYSHLMRFWHPELHKIQRTLPSLDEAVLTYRDFVLEEDLTTMINPIKEWRFSPRHPVSVNGSSGVSGVLIGTFADLAWNETNNVLVELRDGSVAQFPLSSLTPEQTHTNSPLSDPSVKVWRSASMKAAMAKFLSAEMMPGKTAAQALKIITDANIPVYIIGGAVRDLAEDKDVSAIHDIDLAFGCSPKHLEALLESHGVHAFVRDTGLIKFGALTHPYIEMEGKAMLNFFVSTSNTKNKANNVANILTRDVALDVVSKDVSINSLYYDVLNDTVIDPSGNGIQDLARKVLRPPCRDSLWSVWMGDNPTKIGRLIEFALRRPDYTHPDGLVQAARAFLHDYGNMQNCESIVPYWYANRMSGKDPAFMAKFTKMATDLYHYDFARAKMLP